MDQMLGHPAVDPHGDPIPTAEGTLASQDYVDLLAAPTGIRLVIERVLDQDADFLRFIEARHLIPGTEVVVESRDLAADAVKVRSMQGESVTVGTRAASKLLVSPLS
jgi:DtxR family Mn-dependent transcriptional regulator